MISVINDHDLLCNEFRDMIKGNYDTVMTIIA